MYFRRLILTGLLSGLLACGGGSDGSDAPTPTPLPPSGLSQRPDNPLCIAPPRPPQTLQATLKPVFTQLSFQLPVGLLQAPGDDSRWFVLEQLSGLVKQFPNRPDATDAVTFLDISDRVFNDKEESGLLGMAFHPNYPATPYVYVSYTRQGAPLISYISRFTSLDGGRSLDASSEQVLLTLDQPSNVHQGGHINFGPDGYLYIGFGDGGHLGAIDPTSPLYDPFGHGQNTDTLFGALLRIDVDTAEPYAIPSDNPFVSGGGRPEIYAWGFRNPWRWSFDPATGGLWLGDVGEGLWEEINRVERNGNYGWSLREGTNCLTADAQQCLQEALIDPWYQYDHTDGCAIIGGYVYRGKAWQELQGSYVFGDFCSGQIWRLEHDTEGQPYKQTIARTNGLISALGTDQAGELYLLQWQEGRIFKLAPDTQTSAHAFPLRLSQTGCVDPEQPTLPAASLIPYSVNAPLWSDKASKQRWLALPDGATITINEDGTWELPKGSVLLKNFYLTDRLIETRLLVRHQDGDWAGYSYAWREDGNDADYVPGGQVRQWAGQDWIYPSSDQCLQCHTKVAGFTLGLSTAQLNRDQRYPSTGITANQLVTLNRIGFFHKPLAEQPQQHPSLPDPFDPNQTLADRARAYLHSNCAQCHQPEGPTRSNMDLRYQTALNDTNTCQHAPEMNTLGVAGARLIQPGAPEQSIVLNRMNRRDIHRMPPLGSVLIDEEGVALIHDWLTSIADCQ